MARNKAQPVAIDFDTGDSAIDEYGVWRTHQQKLFSLKNPYTGNKRSILPDIAKALSDHQIKYESVLDLFSGSGVVSLFFKLMGKDVYSNDLLMSNYYNTLCLCEEDGGVPDQITLDWLLNNENSHKDSFVKQNYSNRFTEEEADFLDNYRANVDALDFTNVDKEASLLCMLHYVLNNCFLGGRLNGGQVLANLEHRVAHNRNKGESMKFQLAPLPTFKSDYHCTCKAYNGDALEAIDWVMEDMGTVDLAYLDPPYGGDQSDYAQMYAFCEEYVLGDKLDNLEHIQQNANKFVNKKDYTDQFDTILQNLHWIPTWAISFNASSYKSVDKIVSQIKNHKKEVTVVDIKHQYHYRLDRGAASEYLFIAR